MNELITALKLKIDALEKEKAQTVDKALKASLQKEIDVIQEQIDAETLAQEKRDALAARNTLIQEEVAKLDLTKQDYDIENELDDDGNIVSSKVVPRDLTDEEKKARAKMTEPEGATKEELNAVDPATHKIIEVEAGMADGSIKQIARIVPLTQQEIDAYNFKAAKEKIVELRNKVTAGTATDEEIKQMEALIEAIKV